MTDTRIARRYASAIFALGENEGKTANAKRGETLKALDSLLDESPALDRVFKSPIISVAEKKKIVGNLLAKLDADPVTRNFCNLLADKDRLAFFRAIVQAFTKKLDEAQQIIRNAGIVGMGGATGRQAEDRQGRLGKEGRQGHRALL